MSWIIKFWEKASDTLHLTPIVNKFTGGKRIFNRDGTYNPELENEIRDKLGIPRELTPEEEEEMTNQCKAIQEEVGPWIKENLDNKSLQTFIGQYEEVCEGAKESYHSTRDHHEVATMFHVKHDPIPHSKEIHEDWCGELFAKVLKHVPGGENHKLVSIGGEINVAAGFGIGGAGAIGILRSHVLDEKGYYHDCMYTRLEAGVVIGAEADAGIQIIFTAHMPDKAFGTTLEIEIMFAYYGGVKLVLKNFWNSDREKWEFYGIGIEIMGGFAAGIGIMYGHCWKYFHETMIPTELLREKFKEYDEDGNDELDMDEWKKFYREAIDWNASSHEIEEAFSEADVNSDGGVQIGEFIKFGSIIYK